MMKKNRSPKGTIIIFSIMFMILALLMGAVYTTGLNRPAIVYSIIPQLTKDYLNKLYERVPDQGLSAVERGPFDWDNSKDEGNKGWDKEENENFIVYYHKDKNAVWQKYAMSTLKEAQMIIPELKDLMGKFYYPADLNNRKLPIYLANSPDDYFSIIQRLMGGKSCGEGTAGIYVAEVGPSGCLSKGIVLHPSCFEDNSPNDYHKTLRHEMNHYVFYSSMNYGKEIKHYLWVCEGLAEYFCENHINTITGVDSLNFIEKKCLLSGEFPREMHSEYWAGESFFRFLEQTQGKECVKKFIKNSYQYSTDSTFTMCKLNQLHMHEQWVSFLRLEATVQDTIPDQIVENN